MKKKISENRIDQIIQESIEEILFESPKRSNTREFVRKSKERHGNKYKYNKVGTYKNNRTKVNIVCPQHGIFRQRPKDHLRGQGCPMCYDFKLESMVWKILSDLGVNYERRIRPKWMNGLELDIYIPSLKIAIECQGIQHYQPVSRFGGVEGYEQRKIKDAQKANLCMQNNVPLYYVKYTDKDISNVVKNIISNHTQKGK